MSVFNIIMTFSEIRTRFIRFWWVAIASLALAGMIFSSWVDATKYQASITVGIAFNSSEYMYSNGDNSARQGYVLAMTEFTKYLAARFTSIEIQARIEQKMNIPSKTLDNKKAFYNVTPVYGGFVSIDGSFNTEDEGKTFNNVIKDVYKEIITVEQNKNVIKAFQIKPADTFVESVVAVSKPAQIKILPFVSGFLVGLVLILFIPKRFIKD